MEEINDALKGLLLKIITTISSTKFWFILLGMAASGYLAYQTGGVEAVILAVAGIIGLPIVYTVQKTKQNIGLASVTNDKLKIISDGGLAYLPPEVKDTEGLWQIDLAAFHRNVMNSVAEAYGTENPATIYYNAERLGQTINAGSWENAQDYWDYIAQLADDAYTYVHGEDIDTCKKKITERKGGCTGWDLASHCRAAGFEHYVALLKLQRAKENMTYVAMLEGKCDYSLYNAGEMARYLV